MTTERLCPWIAVCEHMNADYQHYVVETALNHIAGASQEIRKFSIPLLSNSIRILHYPTDRCVLKRMKNNRNYEKRAPKQVGGRGYRTRR